MNRLVHASPNAKSCVYLVFSFSSDFLSTVWEQLLRSAAQAGKGTCTVNTRVILVHHEVESLTAHGCFSSFGVF